MTAVWRDARAVVAVVAVALTASAVPTVGAQQVADSAFAPAIARPVFAAGAGPRLCVDEAHHNFHTLDGRFYAFGALARRDGFVVVPSRAQFTSESLRDCAILVISNAQPSAAEWDTFPYPTPSAFSPAEIAAVRVWVEEGGRLLLIADHMPLAGAAKDLAAAFGATFVDGFAFKRGPDSLSLQAQQELMSQPTLFDVAEGTLIPHPIISGRDADERVTRVRSFTGQAFRWERARVRPVMVLPPDFVSLEPRVAWQFDSATAQRAVGSWLQGATLRLDGGGRVAFFGEAAMFSAQLGGPNRTPMGMNGALAEQNPQFVLGVLRWLAGVLDP